MPVIACAISLLCGSPALAYWHASGTGTGVAVSATLQAGEQPTATASGGAVTVAWTQSMFRGQPIGTFDGGGYVIERRPAEGGAAVAPAGTCGTTISGSSAALSCEEPGVPAGSWTYTVIPVLMTWTGDPSPASSPVEPVVAPVQNAASPQNPTSLQSVGNVVVSWAAVSGAGGYNIYRRTASGSYDYGTALNGSTPLTGTTYTDPGEGLSSATTYAYVVRAVQGSPASESADSNEQTAEPIARPTAPTGVTATAIAAADVAVSWSAVAGVAGYNVYRRTASGTYNYGAPLNGATAVTATALTDTTPVNASTYHYTIRAVIEGAGGTPVESFSGTESAAVIADSTAPARPTSMTVGAGAGPLLTTATCSIAASTRFVNFAGQTVVPISVAISTPEPGQTLRLSATTSGSTPVTMTVPATSTTVNATMNLSSLLDGAVTLTVRSADAAGNLSSTRSPSTGTRKDTNAVLSGLGYIDRTTTTADQISGTSECGARITAVQTTGPTPGSTYPTSGTFTLTGTTFSTFNVAALRNVAYAYDVTATDLAANTRTDAISGTAVS